MEHRGSVGVYSVTPPHRSCGMRVGMWVCVCVSVNTAGLGSNTASETSGGNLTTGNTVQVDLLWLRTGLEYIAVSGGDR